MSERLSKVPTEDVRPNSKRWAVTHNSSSSSYLYIFPHDVMVAFAAVNRSVQVRVLVGERGVCFK